MTEPLFDLDTMLAAPLAEVADEGFSVRLDATLGSIEKRYTYIEFGFGIACLALMIAFLPATGLARTAEVLALNLGSSVPLAIACAVLALTQSLARVLAD